MDSTMLPAQNRLMKLKQKLKESNKMSSKNTNSTSRFGIPSTSTNAESKKVSSNIKNSSNRLGFSSTDTAKQPLKKGNENTNKLPPGTKLSSRLSATNSKAFQAQKNRDNAKSSSQSTVMASSKVLPQNRNDTGKSFNTKSRKRKSTGDVESGPVKQFAPNAVAPSKVLPKKHINPIKKTVLKNKNNALKEILNKPSTSTSSGSSRSAVVPKPVTESKQRSEKSPNKNSPMTQIQQKNVFKRKKAENIKTANVPINETKNISNSNNSNNAKVVRLPPRKQILNDNENFSLKDNSSLKQPKVGRIPKIPSKQSQDLQPVSILTKTRSDKKIIEETNHPSNEVSIDDSMEWEPNKAEILRFARSESYECEETMDWQDIISDASTNNKIVTSLEEKTVFFVIDTNVFINSMFLVEKLINLPNLRGFKAMVMIPWQVLKELDKLKTHMGRGVGKFARQATRFLSENVSRGSSVVFQTQSLHLEDSRQVLVEVPDDHLIKCCCQLKDKNKNVILLSNDINLRVKSSAIGNILAVADTWLIDLIDEDEKQRPMTKHCFEIEPNNKLNSCGSNISIYMYTLTQHLGDFLFKGYRRQYESLWPLWLSDKKLSILHLFTKFDSLPLPEASKEDFTKTISAFYKVKKSYEDLIAKDVDEFGRKCINFSQNLNISDSGSFAEFEQNMGFLKTGNIYENTHGYFIASSTLAQNFFKMMEDKLKNYLNYLEDLLMKISSQTVIIPDSSIILKKLDKHLVMTNEATTVFLLLNGNKDLPLTCPELVIFHKVLLDFVEIVQENDRLPLFSPEDVSNFVNQQRDFLNPAAIEWLSDTRRKLSECKAFIRNL